MSLSEQALSPRALRREACVVLLKACIVAQFPRALRVIRSFCLYFRADDPCYVGSVRAFVALR